MPAIRHTGNGFFPRRIVLQIVLFCVAAVDFAFVIVNNLQRVNRLGPSQHDDSNVVATIWAPRMAPLIAVLFWTTADVAVFIRTRATHPTLFMAMASVLLVGFAIGMGFSIPMWQMDLQKSYPKDYRTDTIYTRTVGDLSEVMFCVLPAFLIVYIIASAVTVYRNRFIIRLTKSTETRGSHSSWSKITISSRRDSFGSRWSKFLESPLEGPGQHDWNYPPPMPAPPVRVPAIKITSMV